MNDTSFRPYWERACYRDEFALVHLLHMICHKHPSRTTHRTRRLKEFKIIMNVYYLNNIQTVVWAKVIFDAMRCLFFLSVVSSQKLSTCYSRWCNFFHKNNPFDFFNRSSFLITASCSTVLFFGSVVYCQLLSAFLTNSARLAQSVEHETLNLRVVGSSPTLGVHFFPSATTLFCTSEGMCWITCLNDILILLLWLLLCACLQWKET